ncbi:hypothetical protein CI238_13159, partial [Colletotrichum incanum]
LVRTLVRILVRKFVRTFVCKFLRPHLLQTFTAMTDPAFEQPEEEIAPQHQNGLPFDDDDLSSLFSVNYDINQHTRRLHAAKNFHDIRLDFLHQGTKLQATSWQDIRKKHKDNFRSTVEHVVKGSAEGRVLLPLIQSQPCKQCSDVFLLACFVMSKKQHDRVMHSGLEKVFAALLRTTTKFEFSAPDTRMKFVDIVQEVCAKEATSNANLLRTFLAATTSEEHSHHTNVRRQQNTMPPSAHSAKRPQRDTISQSAKRTRRDSLPHTDENIQSNTIEPLILDRESLKKLKEEDVSNKSTLIHPRCKLVLQYAAADPSRIPGAFQQCPFQQAVEVSDQWRQERAANNQRTSCVVAIISENQKEDISFVIRVGHDQGWEIIRYLDFQDASRVSYDS